MFNMELGVKKGTPFLLRDNDNSRDFESNSREVSVGR